MRALLFPAPAALARSALARAALARVRSARAPLPRLAALVAPVVLGALGVPAALATPAAADAGARRVLSLGGSVTEIVFALGEDHHLVGRDTTSTWPPAALDLPDAGYLRALSPEGVLSLAPDLVLAEEGAGPPETIAVLTAADIDLVTVPDGTDAAAVAAKIVAVGQALGVGDRAQALAAEVAAGIGAAAAAARAARGTAPPKRVVFLLSAAGGRIVAAGDDTGAAAMIALAGGENALTGFSGYKPVGDEALAAARPDAVLMMDRGGAQDIAAADLFALPALADSPAARAGALIRIDGLKLLGFGPRTAEAVAELAARLHGG